MYTKKFSPSKKILLSFTVWRIALFLIAFLAIYLIPKWGGWFPYADRVLEPTKLPSWIWGFGNFDGVHYLRIMQNGYNSIFTQAFFPLFPLVGRMLTAINVFTPKAIGLDTSIFVDPAFFYNGLILANVFFALALYYLYRLFRLDYPEKTSLLSLVLLLVFPTAYYFGAIYTESLFLLLTVLCLYSARKKNYLLAGVFAALVSATRIVGFLLALSLLVEIVSDVRTKRLIIKSGQFVKSIAGLFIAPLGTILYMVYLKITTGDPLLFLSVQSSFGAERSSTHLIMLPQVIYRYFKIFTSVPIFSLSFGAALNEFVFTIVPLMLLVILFKKIRFSYWLFTFLYLIIPTLTGTFLSMPRFALMSFLLFPLIVERTGKYFKLLVFVFLILEVILVSLFTRGYWVA
jgi:Gpi18-like mannosyltransferase